MGKAFAMVIGLAIILGAIHVHEANERIATYKYRLSICYQLADNAYDSFVFERLKIAEKECVERAIENFSNARKEAWL